MSESVLVEACVDSIESALAAARGGAHGIELCANLVEGGTTPSAGTLAVCRERLDIPIHVLVRPRGGDFLYTATEFTVMLEDIRRAKQAGAEGVVTGALRADGEIDTDRTRELIGAARPLRVTFHRAFDVCRDPAAALEGNCPTRAAGGGPDRDSSGGRHRGGQRGRVGARDRRDRGTSHGGGDAPERHDLSRTEGRDRKRAAAQRVRVECDRRGGDSAGGGEAGCSLIPVLRSSGVDHQPHLRQ